MSQGPYHFIGIRVGHRPSYTATRRRNRLRGSTGGPARKRWEASEEALGGPLPVSLKKSRGEPRKNGEMDWVKLSSVTPLTEQPASVTPLTVVKTTQCHTPNDGIPSRMSVFEARWFVISQMSNPTSKRENDSNQYIRLRALSPH